MSKYENLCIISDDDIQIIFFYGNIQWNSKSESLKNVFLYIYIFNQDISLKISLKSLKFGVLIAFALYLTMTYKLYFFMETYNGTPSLKV